MSAGAPRVLVLGSVLGQPQGGVRRHNEQLLPRAARLLAERGGRLCVLAPRAGLPFELPAPVELVRADLRAQPPLVRAWSEARAVRTLLSRDDGFDLVHTAHLPVPPLALPYTLTLHDLRRLRAGPAARVLARRALRRAAGGARRVIAVSAALRAEMVDELGLAPQKIALVPNAADHLPLVPRAPGAGAPILCVAHLEPRKNQALLLRALAADPALPLLQMVGAAKGRERQRLERLARELGVAARIAFLGPVGDAELAGLYATCGCVVLPSLVEGYGIPLAEALRASAPVALANLPALLEVARGAGASFDPRDARGCARALRSALALRAVEEAPRAGWADSARALVEAWESAILSPP